MGTLQIEVAMKTAFYVLGHRLPLGWSVCISIHVMTPVFLLPS